MHTEYDESLTMREARKVYFEVNKFGANGGYDDAWVDFSFGPVPFPIPNTASRVKAVRVHDLHHVVTGYDTDTTGEFEISGWEIGAGCKDFGAAWVLNLGGTTAGVFTAPRKVFRAFVRGRRSESLYGETFEPLLDTTVGELRRKMLPKEEPKANAADVALFSLTAVTGLLVGLPLMALAIPIAPFGFVTLAMKKRSVRKAQAAA